MKWLSSEKRTLLHCSTSQSLYFLAQESLFFFIATVNSCFFTGLRAFRPHANSFLRTAESEIYTPDTTKSFFKSILVLCGFISLFLSRITSSLAVVLRFLPQRSFRCGEIVPILSFCFMILFTDPKLILHSLAICLCVILVCSLRVIITLLLFFRVISITNTITTSSLNKQTTIKVV